MVLADYSDVIELAGPPAWWDHNGAPRYGEFAPRRVTVYAAECVLLRIACQACEAPYDVAIVAPTQDETEMLKPQFGGWHEDMSEEEAANLTRLDRETLHYGDPPVEYHRDEDCAGWSMNCDDLEVLQWWRRDGQHEWRRIAEREGPLATSPGRA